MASPADIDQMRFPPTSVAFDAGAFDLAIRAHGVRFVHWRAMPDPVGLVDRHDARRPGEDHSGASNGQIYTRAGIVPALFTGNSKDLRAAQQGGMMSSATAQITTARFYCTCGIEKWCRGCPPSEDSRSYLAPLDRLFLEDEAVLVPLSETNRVHETGDDRLRFPAVRVQDLVDARGTRFAQGREFDVVDGRLRWGAGAPPSGTVYSVRYLLRPFWYVSRMLHETRVAQQESGPGRSLAAMPQSAIVQREYVHNGSEDNDRRAPDPESSRRSEAPASSLLGAR